MRVLGLDVGEKRIGVALSDASGVIASALTVIERKSDDFAIDRIAVLAEQHGVECVVVGMPRSMDGSLRSQAMAVQSFVDLLTSRMDIPLATWDERLSSVAADRMMAEAGVKRDKRKSRRDSLAAAFILQGYLDRQKNDSPGRDLG